MYMVVINISHNFRTTTIALVCDLNAHDPVLDTFSESLEQPDHYVNMFFSIKNDCILHAV